MVMAKVSRRRGGGGDSVLPAMPWLSGGGGGSAKASGGVDGDRERARAKRLYVSVIVIVFDKAHKSRNLESDSRTTR